MRTYGHTVKLIFESAADQGSSFWFTVPFSKPLSPGSMVQEPSLPASTNRVLVIDENETVRQMIQEQLRSWALSSQAVSSGQTALELLRQEEKLGRPFPLVILDMHMPDMDGVLFARLVKNDPALAGTKLIVMTSAGSPLDASAVSTFGFSAWIAKPPKPEELQERLASLLPPQ